MSKVLTAHSVARFKPAGKRLEIPDAVLPGLYLVIQPSGAKSFAVRYRHRGRSRKLTIGRFPVFDLAAAREKARGALQAVAEGRDPCREQRQRRAETDRDDRDSVSAQVETFLTRYVRPSTKARTATEVDRRLRKYVLPSWGSRRVQDITRRDVIELLDGIVDAGTPVTANRTLSTLKTFFGWLVDRSTIEQSPCARVKAPAPETSRDRVLTADELRWLWRASERIFVQMLVLTGQRRDEVAGLRLPEVKDDLWSIPAARTKSGSVHDVPLSASAAAVLKSVPPINGSSFAFTLTGEAPISGYSGAKRKLDALITELAKAEGKEPPTRWTFHDLRRTAASGMARLGVAVNVIEAVLNHRGGEVSGVAAIYNRHSYLPEKQRALELWAHYVLGLIAPTEKTQLNRAKA